MEYLSCTSPPIYRSSPDHGSVERIEGSAPRRLMQESTSLNDIELVAGWIGEDQNCSRALAAASPHIEGLEDRAKMRLTISHESSRRNSYRFHKDMRQGPLVRQV
jgi:hypothetical protein